MRKLAKEEWPLSPPTVPEGAEAGSGPWLLLEKDRADFSGTHQPCIEYDLAALAPCDIQVQFTLNGGQTYGPSLSDALIPEAMRKNVTAGNRAAGPRNSSPSLWRSS